MSRYTGEQRSVAAREHWRQPEGRDLGLSIHNSLTGKDDRLSLHPDQEELTWYLCGPTVYDSAHLGHARSVLSFDLIRRILEDYFHQPLFTCMNVTDIDDKIIKRSIEENVPFLTIARKYEREFFEDCANLGVRKPDVVTRVSEFIPEVIAFVQGLLDRGYAYAVESGSVYFDTLAYDGAATSSDTDHLYGKLEPGSVFDTNVKNRNESEAASLASEKRCPFDFALWKASKPGEPHWESPWGTGRPGWHIECSAMATHVFGEHLSIHAGGMDLRFPHHENEIAQTEGFYDSHQWVDYFIHCGTLKVASSSSKDSADVSSGETEEFVKMSKSLNNFWTIRDVLAEYRARVIRMLFACHRWDRELLFSRDQLEEPMAIDKQFEEFFLNVDIKRRQGDTDDQRWIGSAEELNALLRESRMDVDAAFRRNFDTPSVINTLRVLVTKANIYMSEDGCRLPLLLRVHRFIKHILGSMGFDFTPKEAGHELFDRLMDTVVDFRGKLRKAEDRRATLELCDQFRDVDLVPLGIRVEDQNQTSTWKLVDPEALRQEIVAKEAAKAEREARKADLRRAKYEARSEKMCISSIPPAMLFVLEGAFGAFDENGMPIADAEGNKLSKKQMKKLAKRRSQHVRDHEKYLAQDEFHFDPPALPDSVPQSDGMPIFPFVRPGVTLQEDQ